MHDLEGNLCDGEMFLYVPQTKLKARGDSESGPHGVLQTSYDAFYHGTRAIRSLHSIFLSLSDRLQQSRKKAAGCMLGRICNQIVGRRRSQPRRVRILVYTLTLLSRLQRRSWSVQIRRKNFKKRMIIPSCKRTLLPDLKVL